MAGISCEAQASSMEVGINQAPLLGGSDRIREVLAHKGTDVVTTEPNKTVRDAVKHMHEHHVGSVLVVAGNTLVGIMTERDVLSRVVASNLDPATTLVEEVMTRELVLVDPSVTVADALAIVTRRRCRHLPVAEDGQLCGLVSAGDLAAWLVREQRLAIDDLYGYIVR